MLRTQHEGIETHLEGLLFFFGSWKREDMRATLAGEVTGRGGRQREIGSGKVEGWWNDPWAT